MRCHVCGKDPNEVGVLYRQNEKGQPGVWACGEHVKEAPPADVVEVAEDLSQALEQPEVDDEN